MWLLEKLQDGTNLCAKSDGTLIPVVPSDSKTESRVDITGGVLRDSTRKWEPGRHLTQTLHHGEDGNTGTGITNENRQRAGLSKGGSNTQEETSTNGTTERDELDVTGLETAQMSGRVPN